MKINHIANIPDTVNVFINDVEVQHPKSFMSSSRIGNLHVAVTAMPGNTDKDWICLSVFVDGEQHVIFSGTPEDAAVHFKTKYPRN
jgi:hypothetical protein